jgi:signal transduction histidine kinase
MRQEVLAAERARIARELHDIVAHSVAVMVIQLGAARLRLPDGPAAAEPPLLAAEDVGRQALAELRRLLEVLRAGELPAAPADAAPPSPPQPGLPELDALVTNARATGLDVDVTVEGPPVDLPPGLDLTAYRIVQEALTNTMKHGSARCVRIALRYGDRSLRLEVVDDGRGMAIPNQRGQGLVGIRERVALFGGTADVGPSPTGGWRVAAELPLPVLDRVPS